MSFDLSLSVCVCDLSSPQVAKLPFLINDGKWHHLCITWTTRDGMWEAFQDGVKRGSGENLAPYHPIKPEGVLVVGQEQVSGRTAAQGRWEGGDFKGVGLRLRKETLSRILEY